MILKFRNFVEEGTNDVYNKKRRVSFWFDIYISIEQIHVGRMVKGAKFFTEAG